MDAQRLPLLAIACGGTGGHFYPGLAIALEYQREGGRAILVVAGHNIEQYSRCARAHGIETISMAAVRMPARPHMLPQFIGAMLLAVVRHAALMRSMKIDTALVMGSFIGAPLGLAARLCNRPLFVHEGNSVLGRANRRLARWARAVLLSYPLRQPIASAGPQHVVGMPVRDPILRLWQNITKNATPAGGGAPRRRTLLVFGGSQGAQFVNACIKAAVEKLPASDCNFHLIHMTGTENNDFYRELYQSRGLSCLVKARDDHIENHYAAADLVVCRAGGSTIAEMALLAKSGIYIPLPTATDGHQTHNARMITQIKGGLMIEQSAEAASTLRQYLTDWSQDAARFEPFGRNVRGLAKPDAAAAAVRVIRSATAGGGASPG